MVINHLLTGMILQVGPTSHLLSPLPFRGPNSHRAPEGNWRDYSTEVEQLAPEKLPSQKRKACLQKTSNHHFLEVFAVKLRECIVLG